MTKVEALKALQASTRPEAKTMFDMVVRTPEGLLNMGGLCLMNTHQAFSGIWMDQTLAEHVAFAIGAESPLKTTPSEKGPES